MSDAQPPRVLLVDDHAMVRRGLRELLSDELPGVGVGEAGDGDEALAMLARGAWDLVVTDLSLPGIDGLELLKRIIALYPKLPVLVLSGHPEAEYALRAMRAGASGYITKSSAEADLAQAIRRALAGGKYVSATFAELLVSDATADGKPPHAALSDRELQVLRALGAGRAVKVIALELGLSDKTVSTYRARVLEKLGLTTNAELMRYALRHGLAD